MNNENKAKLLIFSFMIIAFFLGFFGAPVNYECKNVVVESELPVVFLVDNFSVVDGFYYADVDDFRRLRCEVAE